jgi:hypothetical protein
VEGGPELRASADLTNSSGREVSKKAMR